MPRKASPARLVLLRKRHWTEARWFIRWYEGGRKRELTTGASEEHRSQAEAVFGDWLAGRARRRDGPSNPAEITVDEVLAIYGAQHAPGVADRARIGYAIDALLSHWGEARVATIKSETCRRYYRARRQQLEARFPGRSTFDGTIRRELGALSAALRYCVGEGELTYAPSVWLPPKPAPRERWLTRSEAARLLRAARREPKARWHLPLFILICLYCGPRRSSVLALQWQPNTQGGWVDLERGLIDFNPLARTQSKKRRARTPIPDRLLPFLRYARRRTRQYVIEVDGQPVKAIKRSFATAARNAGLSDVTPHILKHTAITWLAQDGVDLWEVAGFTGTSEETIRRVYGHQHPSFLESARQSRRGRAILRKQGG